jgi:hypothetical protein
MRSVVLWTSLGVGALSGALALLIAWPAALRATHPARPGLAKSGDALAAAVLFEASPVHEAIFALAAQPLPQLVRVTGGMRCGDAEMGGRLVADKNARYGIAGPPDNADPHLARRLPERGSPAAFGSLADMGLRQQQPSSRAPTASFGRHSALGTDPESARGKMWGEALNDNAGEDGLGRRGTPGGLAKHIDVEPAAENGTSMLRVLHTGLRLTGARKASEVGRTMAAHFDELRRCAEDAQPTRAQTVELAFDIAADGHTSTSGASLGELERCLEQSLARVTFSAEATEPAHIVYPLYFMPASMDLRSSHAHHEPAAACDCGG